MPRPPHTFDDDDFEQFDVPKAATQPQDEGIQDAYRTRKTRVTTAPEPKQIPENELRSKIKTRAITYLSRREYSRLELTQKLVKAFEQYVSVDQHAAIISQILDELERGNWQSDERYAAQITKVKGERFGVARLKYEFKQKGLSEDLVQRELAILKSTELERAQEIWRKKFNQAPSDLKEKAKQVRFMASRGFSYDIVSQIIKGLDDEI